jgi:surface protein
VTNMLGMFYGCNNLTSLDLSSFDTQDVTSMGYMFQNCTALKTVYVGNAWSTAKVTASTNMFRNCTSLVGGRGTTYNASNPQDKTYAHIDGGTANPGYFSEKGAALRGDVNNDGKVDVTDVNIVVNIILGKDQASNYDGRADVNNSGGVDVSDVNTIVNIVLGKE